MNSESMTAYVPKSKITDRIELAREKSNYFFAEPLVTKTNDVFLGYSIDHPFEIGPDGGLSLLMAAFRRLRELTFNGQRVNFSAGGLYGNVMAAKFALVDPPPGFQFEDKKSRLIRVEDYDYPETDGWV